MVFRLPTPFDTIVPPAQLSNGRRARARPWRGTFLLQGINLFQSPDGQQRLFVSSAETEGDNSRTDIWPKQFDMHVTQPACPLSDVQAWVTRNEVPLCMFMPDRHAAGGVGSPGSVANETRFRSLSVVLSENHLICITPWPNSGSHETRNGAGILIYPNSISTGLLVGAIFIDTPFPDFVGVLPDNDAGSSTSTVPSGLPATAGGGIPEFTGSMDLSSFAPLADPGSGSYDAGSVVGQNQIGHVQHHTEHGRVQLRRDDSSATASGTMRSIRPPHGFPMTSPSASYQARSYHQSQAYSQNYSSNANTNTKPQMDIFSGSGEGTMMTASAMGTATSTTLRAALAAAPFDWSMFDDTTDGSGSTSPGSTRTW